MKTLWMAAAAVLLAVGSVGAQEPAKQKQLPAPKEVGMPANGGGGFFTTREWHAGRGYGYGPFPGYGGYNAPFYQGYYPGYGMGYFGYDWSPARMRITEINFSTTPPAVPGAGAPVKSGDSTARAMVLAVKEWADAKTFTDENGRRWKLSSGKELDPRPKVLSGWMLENGDGTAFYTATGRLFRMEAAEKKDKGKG